MTIINFREIKQEIRIIGIDDTPFIPKTPGTTQLIGVVFRGRLWIEGVLQTSVTIDGFDVTAKIASMILNSPHYGQLRVIMLDGITFGGFNIVDIDALFTETHLPIIVVCEKRPDLQSIKDAIQHTKDWRKRWALLEKSGTFYEYKTKKTVNKPIFVLACLIFQNLFAWHT
ncbi:MAG: endonuclease dU [Candidatus Helarchaeota archaeon]